MAKKIAYCSALTAVALMLGYIEALIPFNVGIPGVKIGLTNIVIVVALYVLNKRLAFTILLLKVFLIGLLFGGVSSIIYSLAGGILSFVMMILFQKIKSISVTGISMIGGISHNIGQIAIASLVVANIKIFYYLPYLFISGIVSGILVGIASSIIIERSTYIFKDFNR